MSASGERQRAPGTVGCPRPRVQVTWADERAAHGVTQTGSYWQSALATKEICNEAPSNRRRPLQRGAVSDAKADVSLCASPVPSSLSRRTHRHPLPPPICPSVCLLGEQTASGEAAPSRRFEGYHNSSLQRGQRNREKLSLLRKVHKENNTVYETTRV